MKKWFGIFVVGLGLACVYNYFVFSFWPLDRSRTGFFVVDVPPQSTFSNLRENFAKQGVKINRLNMKFYLQLFAHSKKLMVGEFLIDRKWSQAKAFEEVLSGPMILHKITVKEGFNLYDIQSEFAIEHSPKEVEEIRAEIKARDLLAKAEIPAEVPPQYRTLEGFLFPETYSISKYDSPKKLISSMIEEFKQRAIPILKEHPWGATPEGRFKLLILASIVEKESGNKEEQPLVASVFWNRIEKKMKLQSDPTTIYALFPSFDGNLKKIHLLTPTVYNTYTLPGLPVGPISNPGETALKAVVHPAHTKYFYFVGRGDGTHAFAEDFKTHNANVRQFQLKQN